MRVLIVDDSADAVLPLRMLLEVSGHQVTVALDGKSALAHASETFDAVLCDLRLPDMPGEEVARALGQHPRLVAMTGMPREKVPACFTHYLRKPVDFDDLQRILQG
ncbi:MAG: response regulator [Myxococcales bacterium]|nr:response regulator [Myxococcales bacterium]